MGRGVGLAGAEQEERLVGSTAEGVIPLRTEEKEPSAGGIGAPPTLVLSLGMRSVRAFEGDRFTSLP